MAHDVPGEGPPASDHLSECLLVVLEEPLPLSERTALIGVTLAQKMSVEVVFHVAIGIEPIDAATVTELDRELPLHREACQLRAQPLFDAAQAMAERTGVASRCELTIDEEPLEAVLRLARDRDCALILVGSHGRGGISRMLHASLVDQLVRESDRPVLVCREDMTAGPLAAGTPRVR